MKAINANPVYDQFALSDQVGIITSSRMMKVLRHLRDSRTTHRGDSCQQMRREDFPQGLERSCSPLD